MRMSLAQAIAQPSAMFDRLNYRSYVYNRELHPHVPVKAWAYIWGDDVFFFEVRYQRTLNCAYDLEVGSEDTEMCPCKNECPRCGMCKSHCKSGEQGGCGVKQ